MYFKMHIVLIFVEVIWTANIHDCIHAKRWLVMGAGYHTIHHITYHHNYGHFTIWMDWMFGTLCHPTDDESKKMWYESLDLVSFRLCLEHVTIWIERMLGPICHPMDDVPKKMLCECLDLVHLGCVWICKVICWRKRICKGFSSKESRCVSLAFSFPGTNTTINPWSKYSLIVFSDSIG